MKRLLLLTAAVLLTTVSYAKDQLMPMLEQGKTWAYVYHHFEDNENEDDEDGYDETRWRVYYTLSGDTVIDGREYMKMYRWDENSWTIKYYGAFREDEEGRVWQYDYEGCKKDYMLADFTLSSYPGSHDVTTDYINNNGKLVMRRPHCNFWSWQGDEWNLFGDYDMTFRIPPVPYSGEWQLRLGYCAIETRGVMQSYYGDSPKNMIPQGIPVDMTQYLNSETYMGDRYVIDESLGDYKKKSDEEKAEEQKMLKNLGVYRDGRSQYHFPPGGTHYYFMGNERTHRKIIYQGYVDANSDHFVRFRVASDGKQGNNNEFMFDFFELVPKSVYGVDGDGEMEDDL